MKSGSTMSLKREKLLPMSALPKDTAGVTTVTTWEAMADT
jgi:hypothetical protein